MTTAEFSLIDFHCHFIPPGWTLPEPRDAHWRTIHRRIADEAALLEAVDSGDLTGRVVNTPTALFAPDADADDYRRINDQLAALAARHPGRIHALASVDAFAGEAGAREAERALDELGLHGLFVDSAKGEHLLDAPEARPVLAAAAERGTLVFVHPVNPQPLTAQLAPYGRLGTLLARGTVNAASLVALIGGGVFDELPGLRVAVTALAVAGLVLPAGFGEGPGGRPDIGALLRRHVHVDTMGFDPVFLRAAAAILGPGNLLAGSDWPIVSDGPIAARAEKALIAAGLDAEERALVGSGNVRRLLDRGTRANPAPIDGRSRA